MPEREQQMVHTAVTLAVSSDTAGDGQVTIERILTVDAVRGVVDGLDAAQAERHATRVADCHPRVDAPFAEIKNGDCTFFCLAQILHLLAGRQTVMQQYKAAMAAAMREYVFAFIECQWLQTSAVVGMRWADHITITQNIAVSEQERDMGFEEWGDDDSTRKASWMSERDTTYGGITETAAFVEIMRSRGIPLTVRIWRQDAHGQLMVSARIPEVDLLANSTVHFADILHSGDMDTDQAHMRLLSNECFRRHSSHSSSAANQVDWSEPSSNAHTTSHKKKVIESDSDNDSDVEWTPTASNKKRKKKIMRMKTLPPAAPCSSGVSRV